jgi:hypothetical protein
MAKPITAARLAKGTNLVELVKLLRHVRKLRSFPSFSPSAERLLEERVLPTAWYPHAAFLELVEFSFRSMLGNSEAKAYEMGAAGGRVLLQGSHKALLNTTSPVESVLAMRHAWQAHFNFGVLRAEADGRTVTFRLSDYADVPPSHAYMIAGWGAASGQLAGAVHANAKVLEGPWDGARELVYQVSLKD